MSEPRAPRLDSVVRAFCATRWAILPAKLEAMVELLNLRAAGHRVDDAEVRRIAAGNRAPKAKVTGKIAVIPIYGVVAQRMDILSQMSGGTSTERVSKTLDLALRDPEVGAIVLDVDSPGGSVSGVEELSKKIYDARGTKPIIAVANALCASAAYWIASAADELVVTPSGEVGSIGVFAVHTDVSEADAKEGIKRTVIKAGKYKAEGLPFEPLSEDAKVAAQAQIDEFYEMFVGAVARNRGVKAAVVRSGYGEGRTLTAKQALDAGMVDRIASLDEQIARMRGAEPRTLPGVASARSAAAVAAPVRYLGLSEGEIEIEPDDDEMPDDNGVCPDCGAPLDDQGNCTNCDYTAPMSDDESAAGSLPTSRADGAARTDVSNPPNEPAPVARENTVSNTTTAPAGASAAPMSDRTVDLMALGNEHGKSLTDVSAWVQSGKSVEDVRKDLLASYRAGAAPVIATNMKDREAEKPFASFGEQMMAVIAAGKHGRVDKRLSSINDRAYALERIAGTPSGMNESVGSEGGFFIQPDLLPGVIDPIYTEDPILSRVTRIPIGAQSTGVKYNVVDETSRATGSRWGGVQGYWAAEADQATASKPKLRRVEMDLKKLICLGYLTDELMADASAAEALFVRAFAAEIAFMTTAALFTGSGNGQPLGFKTANALVTQAIEATQTIANSAQFVSQNVAKMIARIPAALWKDVIWLYNQELLPTLMNATVASSSIPVFVPLGGFGGKGTVDTIMGRPAFASEFCEAVGTPGDIYALVPSQYHLAEKGGPQSATSVHVRFLYDESALRITYRIDGQPIWKQAVTPYKGANTRSAFVNLNTRS